jgi:hypothetical protein
VESCDCGENNGGRADAQDTRRPSHSCAKRRGHCGGHFAPRLLARRTTHAELWHNLPIVSQRNTSHGHAILHDELVRAFRRAEIPHAHLSKLRFHFVTHKECS